MTVPGKGGRPRKWRSDADRVRAYRARQKGTPEPPLLVQALDDGDELARALELARQLAGDLDTSRAENRQLRKELARAQRALKTERRRFAWMEGTNSDLAAQRDRAIAERDDLGHELAELRDQPRTPEPAPRELPTRSRSPEILRRDVSPESRDPNRSPPLSRAERRRLERERHRRRGER